MFNDTVQHSTLNTQHSKSITGIALGIRYLRIMRSAKGSSKMHQKSAILLIYCVLKHIYLANNV